MLTKQQESEVFWAICSHAPRFYKLDFYLWCREAVCQYIREKYGCLLSNRVIGNYLTYWGLVLDTGQLTALQRCIKNVRDWIVHEFENSGELTQHRSSTYWACRLQTIETCMRSENIPTSMRAAREDPRSPAKKLSIGFVISSQGKHHWLVIAGDFTKKRQNQLLRGLLKDAGKGKVFLLRNCWTYCITRQSSGVSSRNCELIVLPPLLPRNDRVEELLL
jgi:hypothetical protein